MEDSKRRASDTDYDVAITLAEIFGDRDTVAALLDERLDRDADGRSDEDDDEDDDGGCCFEIIPFSFYGSKSRIAGHYAEPQCPRIIEPFSGSAAYAFRHWEHDVWINEKDPVTFGIWQFLTSPTAPRYLKHMPQAVAAGQRISELFDVPRLPVGFVAMMRSFASCGAQGMRGVRDVVTSYAAARWAVQRRYVPEVIRRVRHWKVTNLDYRDLPNPTATWFIDPPYKNAAGRRYSEGSSAIDFDHLGKWCLERKGQVIVCENLGASWLPFKPMNVGGRNVRSQKSGAREVVFSRDSANVREAKRKAAALGRTHRAAAPVRTIRSGERR